MRHRILRLAARMAKLISPPPITPHTPLRPSPTARRERAASHPLDTPLNVDAPLVRPYLTACEVRVGDQQARRFARMRTMHGEFAV
ncbi:hypothetical protein AB0B15_15300 [Streptomyces sp. NPDC045456]|uniref:hypothetical protein n=1 Tax=Streptomyces sp. NPDC045456 TaxID=3155254 RepID=UPI0033F007E5